MYLFLTFIFGNKLIVYDANLNILIHSRIANLIANLLVMDSLRTSFSCKPKEELIIQQEVKLSFSTNLDSTIFGMIFLIHSPLKSHVVSLTLII